MKPVGSTTAMFDGSAPPLVGRREVAVRPLLVTKVRVASRGMEAASGVTPAAAMKVRPGRRRRAGPGDSGSTRLGKLL